MKELWSGLEEAFVPWVIDLSRAFMLWAGIAIAHGMQVWVLAKGWTPFFIHAVDILEEGVAFVSICAFLLSSLSAFVWSSFQRAKKEIS